MDIREISKLSRELIGELTGQRFDAIALCEAVEDGWRVVVDVIESEARMGDDDLLSTYEMRLAADGALTGYRRLSRQRRFEDRSPAAA